MRFLRRLALALWLACFASAAVAAPVMTVTQFRDAYASAIKVAIPGVKVTAVADDELDIEGAGLSDNFWVDNAYNRYVQQPDALDDILAYYVSTLTRPDRTAPATADALVALVRPAGYVTAQANAVGADKGPLLFRPIAGDLVAIVAIDTPQTYEYPPASTLRSQLHLDDAAIWDRALANTRDRLKTASMDSMGDGVFVFTNGDGLASSRLLDTDFWNAQAGSDKGPPVAAPFAKDVLGIADGGHPKGVRILRKTTATVPTDADGLSQDLLVWKDGAWSVLPP